MSDSPPSPSMPPSSPLAHRVLVVCARRYNGHELWTLLGILHKANIDFEVVSTSLEVRDELTMRPNSLGRTVYEVDSSEVDSYDGIVVVSGNMADTEAYWTDVALQTLIASFKETFKMTAAICCSVPTLAPISTGRKVSFFPLMRSRARLAKFGAILCNTSLTVDGSLITAENQMMTEPWAEEIVNYLRGGVGAPLYILTDSGFKPKGRERRMQSDVRSAINEAKALKLREQI